MDRGQLKSLGVAAADRGNALFLDEGDKPEPYAVVFEPLDGTYAVYSTDHAGTPVAATRRTFGTDAEAFDAMYERLREQADARPRPSLVDAYRWIGIMGTLTTLIWIATALGWLWISPFTSTADETRKFTGDSGDRGEFIFPADTGLPVVAICYSLAIVNVAVQWSLGRHCRGAARRRALQTAVGTAFFAAVALVCMAIRSSEIEDLFFWFPPVLALVGGVVVALALMASRDQDSSVLTAAKE